ncbi:hypothetical protein R3P38DRAFT_2785270 [Favolaschia claudopus]|uniref:Uncharacterized protein n=1 Tax=Favolaschia claudopus TaxID=2862362 RepID=A0AAW0ATR5_9AGAR
MQGSTSSLRFYRFATRHLRMKPEPLWLCGFVKREVWYLILLALSTQCHSDLASVPADCRFLLCLACTYWECAIAHFSYYLVLLPLAATTFLLILIRTLFFVAQRTYVAYPTLVRVSNPFPLLSSSRLNRFPPSLCCSESYLHIFLSVPPLLASRSPCSRHLAPFKLNSLHAADSGARSPLPSTASRCEGDDTRKVLAVGIDLLGRGGSEVCDAEDDLKKELGGCGQRRGTGATGDRREGRCRRGWVKAGGVIAHCGRNEWKVDTTIEYRGGPGPVLVNGPNWRCMSRSSFENRWRLPWTDADRPTSPRRTYFICCVSASLAGSIHLQVSSTPTDFKPLRQDSDVVKEYSEAPSDVVRSLAQKTLDNAVAGLCGTKIPEQREIGGMGHRRRGE